MSTHDHILNLQERKARAAIERIAELLERGEFSYTSDMLAGVTKEYLAFWDSITAPTITPEEMRKDHFLNVSAIRRPLVALDEDLTVSYEQLERIRRAAEAQINMIATERAGLGELLELASSKVGEARIWTNDSDPTFKWSCDSFTSYARIDRSASTARISTTLGVATLAIESEKSLAAEVAEISIAHSGQDTTYVEGMPGNSIEISAVGWAANPEEITEPVNPAFVGESYRGSNPSAILDGNPNTFFEWERYLVPMYQPMSVYGSAYVASPGNSGEIMKVLSGPKPVAAPSRADAGRAANTAPVTEDYGWQHTIRWPSGNVADESIHWIVTPWPSAEMPAGDATALRLDMLVKFKEPQELSWLELLPYLPATRRGDMTTARLESIQVSENGSDGWIELVNEPDGVVLSPNYKDPIKLEEGGIPVKDYTGAVVRSCSLKRVKSVRIRMKQTRAYQTMIGHQYFLKTTQTVTQKKTLLGSKTSTSVGMKRVPSTDLAPSSTGGKITGFGPISWGKVTTVTDLDVVSYYDIFKAWRYCLGIRDLGLFTRVYSKTSSVVSKPHLFGRPIKQVAIISGEHIPEGWPATERWIEYEVSSDRETWQACVPQNGGSVDGAIVTFDTPTRQVYVRIVMKRPDSRPSESPVLSYYTIKALPEEK